MGPDGRCGACGTYQQQLGQQAGQQPYAPSQQPYPQQPSQQPPYPQPFPQQGMAAGMPVGGADLRRGLRIALMVALSVCAAVLLLLFWARTQQRLALEALLDDGVTATTQDDAEAADGFVAFSTVLYFLTLAASATLWAIWMRRARQNAELFAPGTHRFGAGWAAGAWFTPVVNFWFPKQIVNDIYRASAPAGAQSAPKGLLNSWWTLWIGSAALNLVGSVMAAGASAKIQTRGYDGSSWREDVGALKTAASVTGFATLLTAVAGVLAVLVVRQLGSLQEQRALAGPQSVPPGGVPYAATGYPPVQPGPGAGWNGPPQNRYGSGPAGY
ncbi:DUF4328 domain-containing protein [Streptomyces sp. ISL-11]|uniref:DUF4328 domain-containing protein n=1 Tax=Streptomyces sp. ISL-11 TaxID=2819174 RepID=UPI001BE9D02B|nr:DUF4328 domain-containing protein [Streptomyces sp. ISL-11]MBT2384831.1 DUF4328 domain-containing protein [Streptomyces sp. ISL-11]